MAVTSLPVFPQTPKVAAVAITTATTSVVTVYTGGVNGSKVVGLVATTNSTSAAVDVAVNIATAASTTYLIGTISVPLQSGFVSGTNSVNLLDPTIIKGIPTDNDGQSYVTLSSTGNSIQVQANTVVAAGKTIYVTAYGADF